MVCMTAGPRANLVVLRPAALSIVLADEHPVVRGGVRALVEAAGGVRVVGEARSGREAVRQTLLLRPDLLMMDLALGIATITEVRRVAPATAVLIFTLREDPDSVLAAVRAGARGFLHKTAEGDEILRTIQSVAAGSAIFGPTVASRLTDLLGGGRQPFPELTTREREVLDLIAGGLPNSTIARRLNLAPKTVSNHISTIFAKLNLPDRPAAIVRAREAGLGR
jgi:DNA-binding NarL/FixJ family response regulator